MNIEILNLINQRFIEALFIILQQTCFLQRMDKNLDYEIYYESHRQLFNQGYLLPQRKTLLTRIVKLSAARSKDLYIEIGNMSFKSGQFQKALVQLKRAAIINPINYWAHFGLAEAYLRFEKENEAFSSLRMALCLSPTGIPMYQRQVIEILKERGKFDDLESFYQETVNMLPDTRSVGDLYHGGAGALVTLNEYPKAFEMYRKALETDQIKSHYHSDYALALYDKGLFEEAIVQFEHAEKLDPGNKFFLNNRVFLNYCLGRPQKAFEELEDIIANGLLTSGTYPNFILVLYHLDKDEEMINNYRDIFRQNIGEDGLALQSMYEEAFGITQKILEREDIDEETREFNTKKMKGLNLVLSFIN